MCMCGTYDGPMSNLVMTSKHVHKFYKKSLKSYFIVVSEQQRYFKDFMRLKLLEENL